LHTVRCAVYADQPVNTIPIRNQKHRPKRDNAYRQDAMQSSVQHD